MDSVWGNSATQMVVNEICPSFIPTSCMSDKIVVFWLNNSEDLVYINVDRSMRRREITWTNHIQIGKMQVFVVASDSSMSLKMVHGTKKVAGIGKPQLRLSSSPHKSNTQSIFMIYSYHNSPVRADDLWIKFADLWVLGNRPVNNSKVWGPVGVGQ